MEKYVFIKKTEYCNDETDIVVQIDNEFYDFDILYDFNKEDTARFIIIPLNRKK